MLSFVGQTVTIALSGKVVNSDLPPPMQLQSMSWQVAAWPEDGFVPSLAVDWTVRSLKANEDERVVVVQWLPVGRVTLRRKMTWPDKAVTRTQ